MSETSIVELGGEAARMIALQFLGQNLGEMKELDKNIVSSLKPIAGTINPHTMLNSIASAPPQPIPQVPAPQITSVADAVPVYAPPPVTAVSQPIQAAVSADPNQLELNFNNSPYTERVFDKLELLERKIATITDIQQEILTQLSDIKKKLEV
jgi:hypothetical protein